MEQLVARGRDHGVMVDAVFLHESPLLEWAGNGNGVMPATDVGGELAVDLTKVTGLPNQHYSGILVLALDPLELIEDDNRTDNFFAQFVTFQHSYDMTSTVMPE